MRLEVSDSSGRVVAERSLDGGVLEVGRAETCGLRLDSPWISSIQFQLEPDSPGRWWLTRKGLNDLAINGVPLASGERASVSRGDLISLPGYLLLVTEDGGQEDVVALAKRYSQIKTEAHRELLRLVDLRTLLAGTDESLKKEKIRRTLRDVVLPALAPEEELEAFVLTERIRLLLATGLVQGQGGGAAGLGTEAFRSMLRPSELTAFGDVLRRIARDLGVDGASATISAQLHNVFERVRQVSRPRLTELSRDARSALARAAILEDLEAIVFGLGPLEDLIHLPGLNEIMVVGPNRIFVEAGGRLEETGRSFPNAEELEVVIGRIVSPLGRFVNRSRPICDARLSDGSRVNIVVPPVAINGAAITIRKFRPTPFKPEDLVRFGTLTWPVFHFLAACVRLRKNIVVSGGTGSGKTTLLNVLGALIPAHERIVVVEDAAELQIPLANQVNLEAKKANIEGEGEISIRELVRASLRMRPDRIIVGECRGREALDMLQAMNTGHDGSMTTAHANSPAELISRLTVMVLEAGDGLPVAAIQRQLGSAIDIVVQIQRQRDRVRRITHVTEVVGYDEDDGVILEPLFHQPSGHGEISFTGLLPSFITEAVASGEVKLSDLFSAACQAS